MRDAQRTRGHRWGRRRHRDRIADRSGNSTSGSASSTGNSNLTDLGSSGHIAIEYAGDAVRNCRWLQQVFSAGIGRMHRAVRVRRSRWSRCRWWREERRGDPFQARRSLHGEHGDGKQQAQSQRLHGEGRNRSPSTTGRVVPGGFQCAEHDVLRNGPAVSTDTCELRIDPQGSIRRLRRMKSSSLGKETREKRRPRWRAVPGKKVSGNKNDSRGVPICWPEAWWQEPWRQCRCQPVSRAWPV